MVKTERLELIIEILTSQMNHWILFPVIMTVLGIFLRYRGNPAGEGPGLLLWAVCGLIPVACFLSRYYAERFWIFVLCHGVAVGAAVFLASLLSGSGAVVCVVCAAAYTIHSFVLRLRENAAVYSETINPITALGISVAANFLFHRQDDMPDWDRYYVFILIGVLACYLIIYYLKHYLSFLVVNKSSAGYLPAKEILHSGIGFVLPYTLTGVLVLSLSLNVEWLEPILKVLKEILKLILRFLVMLLPNGEIDEEPILTENVGYAPEAGEFGLFPAETFWLWEVLEYVAIVLFVCGCAYALVKLVIKAVRIISDRFRTEGQNVDILTGEAAIYDIREKCSIEKSEFHEEKAGLFRRFSCLERIRRMYRKRVLSGMTGGLEDRDRAALNCMTARECADKLSLPGMADIYEWARYSGREATAEDVRRMKLAIHAHRED